MVRTAHHPKSLSPNIKRAFIFAVDGFQRRRRIPVSYFNHSKISYSRELIRSGPQGRGFCLEFAINRAELLVANGVWPPAKPGGGMLRVFRNPLSAVGARCTEREKPCL